MIPLDKTLRNKLERTIKDARDIAETAALAALSQLCVDRKDPDSHLSEKQKELRRKLRVHGRQLGDSLNGGKIQTMDRLVEEVAYEHWHRMLFARFLADNNLLMYPDPDGPVAVTLEECEDLATDEGATNGWELAARFAARMLPQIFRPDSPVFLLMLPPEHEQKLERLLADLPRDVFTASDSLGWVYQFWQAKKKDEVNASEVKIGARELPAVTQLFTEPYMVAFLLDNSLGAWWAARRLTEDDLKNAQSEKELRAKAALPGMPLEYLRFIKKDDGAWTPAAGTFAGWPKYLRELKTLDPCCGSGHFLVAAFLMLVAMRMELESLTAREAVDRVLSENIHGLELDQRCVELAAFALALTAWKYQDAGGYRILPELNLASSGLSVGVPKEEWQKLAGGDKNLRLALGLLYDEFMNAPVLGSLLDPRKSNAAKLINWDDLAKAVKNVLKKERSEEEHEAGVVAQGLAKAATLLAGQYHWIITNVPYLSRGKQDERLRDFCEKHHAAAKNDIATVFLERCLELCVKGGTSSIVLPQNWLFLTTYEKFRVRLLKIDTWHLIARMGEGAFESSAAAGAFVALITLSRGNAAGESGGLFADGKPVGVICGVDVSASRTAAEKATQLIIAEIKPRKQAKMLENLDAAVQFVDMGNTQMLSHFAYPYHGISTTDYARFGRNFWELLSGSNDWIFQQTTIRETSLFAGKENILLWENGQGQLKACQKSKAPVVITGLEAWGKSGIAITQMRHLPATIYTGNAFDDNTGVLITKKPEYLLPMWCFCSSSAYNEALREIDQTIKVTYPTLVKVPFDLDHWKKIAAEKYPNGLSKPYSDDPTQWIFHGHLCGSVVWDEAQKWTAIGPMRTDATVLQVAVARLLGYTWPAETDEKVDISDEARQWIIKAEKLASHTDKDGIVCIPSVRGEISAFDRLINLLAAAYGDQWSTNILSELLNQSDHAGKSLDTWLRDKFFLQHCKLFHHRPFIWHIWDGLRDGFSALVNYHRLNHKTLETLIYTYLGDWITRQKDDIRAGVDGAAEKLAAAEALKKKLELILEGEAPYDIFVRWKPIEKQHIGWNPDLNDGVRLNIRPFMIAEVLRFSKKPQINISWGKDRGKDVPSAPWYHLFNGDRVNDHHLTLAEKHKTRSAK